MTHRVLLFTLPPLEYRPAQAMDMAIRASRIESICVYYEEQVEDQAFVAIRHTSQYFLAQE